jgi:uncharacterized damage-inducible protein DinB
MNGRPHAERLIKELNETRNELANETKGLQPEDLSWAPKPDMKTYGALLQEIGAMEQLCIRWLTQRAMLDWHEVEKSLAAATDPAALLRSLEEIRAETLKYLRDSSEETLETPIEVAEDWHKYMGPELEPEEFVRWISRHEYYHLGQIISYRWIQGNNPFKQG